MRSVFRALRRRVATVFGGRTARLLRTSGMGLASLMVAAACRDEDLMNHRRFVLTSIDGVPLPAVAHQTVSGRYLAVADTIVFTTATRGFHTRVLRVEPSIAQPVETTRTTAEFTYELVATTPESSAPSGTINLSYVCRDDVLADCLAGPHLSGTLHETSLSLRVLHQSPEREWMYVRR